MDRERDTSPVRIRRCTWLVRRRMDGHVMSRGEARQATQDLRAVGGVVKDGAPFDAPRNDVVESRGGIEPWATWHGDVPSFTSPPSIRPLGSGSDARGTPAAPPARPRARPGARRRAGGACPPGALRRAQAKSPLSRENAEVRSEDWRRCSCYGMLAASGGGNPWRQPNGQWAVTGCRLLLGRLQRRGWITLPASRRVPRCAAN
jgi:hypothetical protein